MSNGHVCIIPARGGSRRIPGKNIREFMGKPIIAYSIEMVRMIKDADDPTKPCFERVYVSTDSDEIARVADRYGATPIDRSPGMAEDDVGTKRVVADAIQRHDIAGHALVACVYPCAPLVNAEDVTNALWLMYWRPASFVVAVGAEPLRDAGAFYLGLAMTWQTVPLYHHHTALYVLPEERVCDINTMDDWSQAESKFAAMRGTLQ